MEKAFKISKEHDFYKRLENYRNLVKSQKEFVFSFLEEKGVESQAYYAGGTGLCNRPFAEWKKRDIELGIFATDDDLEKFGKQLCKPSNNNLSYFKKNSKILKEFQDRCIEKEVVVNICKPSVREYFPSLEYFGFSSMLLEKEDCLYLKIECDKVKDLNTTEFTEIKMSEFYREQEEKQ